MTKLAAALAAALALAVTTAAAIPDAAACGGYARFVPERARGQWPSVHRDAADTAPGTVQLELHYPRFGGSEALSTYMDRFDVLDDALLQRLERRLARRDGGDVVASIEEVAPGVWRVTGWTTRPTA